MRLLLLDALATAPLVHPFQAGWVTPEIAWEARSSLTAADLDDETAALLPAGELPLLQESHRVDARVAVVGDHRGLISMRVPVRPDEIERTNVRLYETTRTAFLLARATLNPFYGILPLEIGPDAADAQVVIVEDAEALRPPEAGFAEDLTRAWFILTGQPLVSHVLAIPAGADPGPAAQALQAARAAGHERRKELRPPVAERFAVDRALLPDLYAALRWELTSSDRRALTMLLQHGSKGLELPYVWQVPFTDE